MPGFASKFPYYYDMPIHYTDHINIKKPVFNSKTNLCLILTSFTNFIETNNRNLKLKLLSTNEINKQTETQY